MKFSSPFTPRLFSLADVCRRDAISSENCSTPPTTPLDELALKRHRFFTDLIDAAHAAIEHRVKFDTPALIVNEVVEPEEYPTPPNSKLKLTLHALTR